MHLNIFNLEENEKTFAIGRLISASSPRQEFFLMIVLSIFMATFGLLADNIPVIIGSMLIAPILSPILTISLGIAISDHKLISRSFNVTLKSVVISIIAATLIALFFRGDISTSLIKNISEPSLLYAGIAVVAGLAATFAYIRPNLSDTLPGVAIAVTLIPPLSVIGIGMANFNWTLISGASILLLINILGISLASLVVFSMSNFYVKRKEAAKVIKKEEKEMKKEEKECEDCDNDEKTL